MSTNIEALKEQARTHEQKEEWAKALDLYKKAIEKLDAEEQPDIGLYNRVADLMVRQGQIEAAVGNYEKAIDLYMEAELPNNAIAVCKKIVRNMPQRHTVYLRMGQIRGRQGLFADARQNFLTYAERMQTVGNVDEGLRALTELADLTPDDPEIRLAIAAQMQGHGRTDDALGQLQTGYHLASSRGLPTRPFEQMIQQLGGVVGAAPAPVAASGDAGGFGEIVLTPPPAAEDEHAPAGIEVGGFEISLGAPEEEKPQPPPQPQPQPKEEEAEPLPTFDFGAEEETDSAPLPMMDVEDDSAPLPMMGDEEEGEPLPMLGVEEDSAPLPMLGEEADADAGDALPLMAGFDELETAAPAPAFDASAFGESDKEDREEAVPELPTLEFGGFEMEPPAAPEPPAVSPPPASPSAPAREAAMEEARPRPAPSEPKPVAIPTPQRTAGAAPPAAPAPRQAQPATVSAADPMGHESLAARGDLAGAIASLRKLTKLHPDDPALAQRMVDYASKLGDPAALVAAWLDLADALRHGGQSAKAGPYYQKVLTIEPQNERALTALGRAPAKPAAPKAIPSEGFVDLGSMLLGDDDEKEKTTRFVVAYEEPTGDEHADFAKMLSQFKAKVAENLSADDVKAHQDLGTAYKEMGLIDEAIAEFQQALRASSEHLPTYELLGQCFMEKGEPEAAVRTLKRALEAPYEVEDELLGIYYYLARAFEQTGNTKEALEFYDRVFTLDINFADVTERLRALR